MAKRAELVVVARGRDWLLAWPRSEWDALDEEEQRQVIARQVALMSQNETENRTRRTRRPAQRVRGEDFLPLLDSEPRR